MTRYLVVGGDGLIGGAIAHLLAGQSSEVYRTSRRPATSPAVVSLDLASPDCSIERAPGMPRLLDGDPWIVFLAAAVARYDQCAADPAAARRINVVNLARIAEELLGRGAFLVFLSTNAVFGDVPRKPVETDAPDPQSEYGRQKAESESRLCVLAASAPAGSGVAIVRLTKVISRRTPLLAGWIESLRAGGFIEAARDLLLSPISLSYTVKHLARIGDSRLGGTYHLSGTRDLAYLEFARLLAAGIGAGNDRVRPVDVNERRAGAALPRVHALDMRQTSQRMGIAPQEVPDAVRDLLAERGLRDGENPVGKS